MYNGESANEFYRIHSPSDLGALSERGHCSDLPASDEHNHAVELALAEMDRDAKLAKVWQGLTPEQRWAKVEAKRVMWVMKQALRTGLVVLMMAGVGWGQTIDPSCAGGHLPSTGECLVPKCPNNWYLTADQKKCRPIPPIAPPTGIDCAKKPCEFVYPAPLKCGKYQHEQTYFTCRDGFDCKGTINSLGIAVPDLSDPNVIKNEYCADDLHMVTEREWQITIRWVKLQEEINQKLSERLKKLEVLGPTLNVSNCLFDGSSGKIVVSDNGGPCAIGGLIISLGKKEAK